MNNRCIVPDTDGKTVTTEKQYDTIEISDYVCLYCHRSDALYIFSVPYIDVTV